MKRISLAVAAFALMAGSAFAQQSPSQSYQPSDPEQAARKGTINQPSGEGANPMESKRGTTTQPSDTEESLRKGTINQPGATTTPR